MVLLAGMDARAQDFRNAPPNEVWKTIESAHFSLTFPANESPLAHRLIDIAETYYPGMTARMGWAPSRKTYLLLSNATDFTNGETTPYYYNHIVIFAVPPDAYSSIINYDDWLKMIFIHEYTHVLHLDQSRGLFGFLNDVFGRLFFVNEVEPDWIIEGYAVHNESELTSAGRDRGSYFNALLRLQALHDELPPIDEGDGIPSRWPFGDWVYLYGGKFMQYLSERYSDRALADYSEHYTYVPLLIDRDSKLAFGGRGFASQWRTWEDGIRRQAILTALSVVFSGHTYSRQVTHTGAYTRGPVWDAGGKGIYYTSYDGRSLMGIFYTGTDAGKAEWVARRNSDYSSSVCGRGLFFVQDEYFRNFYLYDDLYRLDTGTGSVKRLTEGARARGVDVSPDCSKAVLASSSSMRSQLMVYDLKAGGPAAVIASMDGNGQFLDPRWSWNGRDIAVAVKDNNGECAIEIMNQRGETVTTVISNSHLNLFPEWSRDDRYVVFSSDMTGIANLYAYSITEGVISRVTNVVGGAYESQISPDDSTIAFTKLDPTGFNIYTMPFDPAAFGKVYIPREFTVQQVQPHKAVRTVESGYSPLGTLVPTWWLPTVSLTSDAYSIGVYTAGSDLIGHNTYSVLLYYTGYPHAHGSPGASVSYTNESFAPEIDVAGGAMPYIAATYTEPASGTSHSYVQLRDNAAIGVAYPINRVRYRQSVGAGYSYTYIRSLSPLPPYIDNVPFTGTLSGITATYDIDTTSVFDTSISREDGIIFDTYFEHDLSVLGSRSNVSLSVSQFRAYLPGAAENHVVYVKGVYGFAEGLSGGSTLFSIGGMQSLFGNGNYTSVPARGYASGVLTGTRAYAASLEYRCPVGIPDRGISTLPFYLDKVSFVPFFDDAGTTLRNISSAGVELDLDTYIGYMFPFRLTFGYAYAFDTYPPPSFYFQIGAPIQ
ncbi:MAG: hypothetical protein M1491_02420 [Deltaproteobacteria bacterium]|nr:hypothetical protein [Deltaproteobacteria bacterium]